MKNPQAKPVKPKQDIPVSITVDSVKRYLKKKHSVTREEKGGKL